ncbi:hypothetical protein [Haliscomenobacter sp.]|uniref:hypothetical protein n=1 Tax=Haliscomenobacter sp. TaxID=2717303 RepID=UPI0035942828
MKNAVNICAPIDWEVEDGVAENLAALAEVEGIWAEVDKKGAEVCMLNANYSHKSLCNLC